ncbi:actin-like ATPase domain-containing protein [Patellaria atrata CBS 101060]|uniref:Phosphotransferase n=1 Tax=Patellaria atrata CBS 101060 TaxID=1346257 RepID=A0A9P4SJK4_9PEZI|nr:actin-like ATPase domain-containing protein [Patellaria atrata CBS 101060]
MLPSLVHSAIFPSLHTRKRLQDVVRPKNRNMDKFLREVRRNFESPLQSGKLLAMSAALQEQFAVKLQASNISMLPTFTHTLPAGDERGTFLALDVGGSTFRVAVVVLKGISPGEKPMQITKMRSFKIDESIRVLEGTQFFDWMAGRIEETLADAELKSHAMSTLSMGLSWSFPINQLSGRNGLLLEMGKGFCATVGCQERDISELIMDACHKRNLNVRVGAIINDGVASLLSCAYENSATRMAVILGTGTNAAIHLPVSTLAHSKFGRREQSWYDNATHVVVNTEYSMFGKNILHTTRWDEYLNLTHRQPDFQPFEHLLGGRYLGEIVRLVMLEAINDAGLFGGEMPEKFSEPYSLDTGILAIFQADDTPLLSKSSAAFYSQHPLSTPPSYADLLFIRQVAQVVSRRAAAYLAVGIHSLWQLRLVAEGLTAASNGHMTIGCNGSVIEKYPGFRQQCQAYLDDLTALSGADPHSVVLEIADEAAIFGAAVAASVPDA